MKTHTLVTYEMCIVAPSLIVGKRKKNDPITKETESSYNVGSNLLELGVLW